MRLRYSATHRRFELVFRDRMEYLRSDQLPKRLGMFYNGDDQVWRTVDTRVAASLSRYGDDAVKARLSDEYLQGVGVKPQLHFRHGYYWMRAPITLEKNLVALTFKLDKKQRLWYTADPFYALKLIKYAVDDDVKDQLLEFRHEMRRRLKLSRAMDADIEIPVPDGLNYYGFQRAGIAYMADTPNSILADDMGVGKTIQIIGLINLLGDQLRNILIICPASLKINWKRECLKWLVDKQTEVHTASARYWPEDNIFVGQVRRIIIINYEILARCAQRINSIPWDLLAADEAHRVKNPIADCTRAFIKIPAERKIVASGTIAPNRPSELFTFLNYLDPRRYPDKKTFFDRYCGGNAKGAQHLDELRNRLRGTLMIRRLQGDVLPDLPTILRQVVVLEDTTGAVAQERNSLAALGVNLDDAVDNPQAFYQQVMQIRKTKPGAMGEITRIRHQTSLVKVPHVIDYLRAGLEVRQKVGCIAYFRDVVAQVAAAFPAHEVVTVTGDMSLEDRQAAVDRIQNDPTARVFAGTYGAAGVGYTLTAINYVVVADLDWTPGVISQAEKRFCRIGSDSDKVHTLHLVLSGSLDGFMIHLVIDKAQNLDRALDGCTYKSNLQETDDDGNSDNSDDGDDGVRRAVVVAPGGQVPAAVNR